MGLRSAEPQPATQPSPTVREWLRPGGRFVFDVHGRRSLRDRDEAVVYSHFDTALISAELEDSGLVVESLHGDLTGREAVVDPREFCVVAMTR